MGGKISAPLSVEDDIYVLAEEEDGWIVLTDDVNHLLRVTQDIIVLEERHQLQDLPSPPSTSLQ